jgi:DNA-binding winged helix-turn-helix (wHTH) protein/Tol biopolymer transport system component
MQAFILYFDQFELDLNSYELRKSGRVIKLEKLPMELLILLAEKQGQLVTREEIIQRLWGDNVFVDTRHGINTAVRKIRVALHDDPEHPRLLQTVAGRGYRLLAPVSGPALPNETKIETATQIPSPVETATVGAVPASPKKRWTLTATVGAAGLAVMVAAVAWYLHWPLPAPHITDYIQVTLDGRHKDIVGTDGSRLYLNLDPGNDINAPSQGIFQLSIADGRFVPITVELPERDADTSVQRVSPDGSSLLVLRGWAAGELEVWVVGSTGRPGRYLTRASDATFSPDSRSVVYATSRGDLYRIPSEGGTPSLIVSSSNGEPADTEELDLSPDGHTIRFTRDNKIWEVSSSGSNLRQLLSGWQPALAKCCGRWTPDGAFFVFVAGPPPLQHEVGTLWAIDERRGRLRSPISEPIQLTSGPTRWGRPIPSRDGERIFSRGVSLRGELVRFDRKSNQLRPWLGGVSADEVYFSMDGKSVAYVSFPDGILWRARVDGNGPVQLNRPPFHPGGPRWSPDGNQILFTDFTPAGVESTYVVSSKGGTPERFIPEDNGPQNDANWSPNGKKVVYCACGWMTAGSSAIMEIRVFEVASRKISTLPDSKDRYSPRWSPDGRHIVALHTWNDPDRRNDQMILSCLIWRLSSGPRSYERRRIPAGQTGRRMVVTFTFTVHQVCFEFLSLVARLSALSICRASAAPGTSQTGRGWIRQGRRSFFVT